MLVIKAIFDDYEAEKRVRCGLRRKQKTQQNFIRYTDYIDDKPCYILELSKRCLCSENTKKLLSAYKGNVVINESLSTEPFIGFLFDESEYFVRALLSSLVNRIKFEKSISSVCIKYHKILICNEAFEIVKNIRNVHFIVNQDKETECFVDECFKRYGTFVKTGESNCLSEFDVYIDLTKMTPDGKCEIYLRGYRCILYPDCSYFEIDDNVKKLLKCGVNKKIACAVCDVKKT